MRTVIITERSDGRGWNKQMAWVVSGWWTQESDRESSAAACECLLNGVRADCVCMACVCPCLGDPKEQSGGGATVVVTRLCYFAGCG